MNLKDKYEGAVCVVTGATSGNGEAVAHRLLKLGAEVHAIGRNREKLDDLRRRGARTYRMDLGDISSIDAIVAKLPKRIDYVFHLAGTSLLGFQPPEREVWRFYDVNLFGPMHFLESLLPRVDKDGGVGAVTSVAPAMEPVLGIHDYQGAKRGMLAWWRSQERVTLISMGFIATNIWNDLGVLGKVVKTVIPGPNFYVSQILRDVANHAPVSYPGVGARLAPILEGDWRPHPVTRKCAQVVAQVWTLSRLKS